MTAHDGIGSVRADTRKRYHHDPGTDRIIAEAVDAAVADRDAWWRERVETLIADPFDRLEVEHVEGEVNIVPVVRVLDLTALLDAVPQRSHRARSTPPGSSASRIARSATDDAAQFARGGRSATLTKPHRMTGPMSTEPTPAPDDVETLAEEDRLAEWERTLLAEQAEADDLAQQAWSAYYVNGAGSFHASADREHWRRVGETMRQELARRDAAQRTARAAKALRDAADAFDRKAAEHAARLDVDDVRCLRCDLRYAERQQYGCMESGRGHDYDEDELAEAAVPKVEPTYDGNQLRDRADRIESEGPR